MGLGIPPLKVKVLIEPDPLKYIILVRRLAVRMCVCVCVHARRRVCVLHDRLPARPHANMQHACSLFDAI